MHCDWTDTYIDVFQPSAILQLIGEISRRIADRTMLHPPQANDLHRE
jgi:hypothetical protein